MRQGERPERSKGPKTEEEERDKRTVGGREIRKDGGNEGESDKEIHDFVSTHPVCRE